MPGLLGTMIAFIRVTPGAVARPGHDRGLTHLSAWSDFSVTIAAVNRLVTARLKGDFGGFPALGAGGGEHLAHGSTAAITLGLPCLSAFGTALGLVSVALGLEKFLIFSAEREGRTTIGACKGFILKTHWMTSSLKDSLEFGSSNT